MSLNNQANNNISNHYSSYPSANQFEITNPARILSTPIKTALQAASSKSSIPVLEGILFELTGEGLVLVGSDLEQWIIVRVPEIKLPLGLTNEPIKFVLPKKVAEAILRLPDGLAVFEFLPERLALKIKYGYNQQNSQTHQLYRADDFVQVPDVQGEEFAFPVDLKRVAFAVGTNTAQPVFTGVLMDLENKRAAAADAVRWFAVMSFSEIPLPENVLNVVFPIRAVNLISEMDQPALTIGDNGKLIQARSEKEGVTMISRLLPYRYPDVTSLAGQIKDEKILFEVEFSSKEMTGALNRVSLMLPNNTMPNFTFCGEGEAKGYIKVTSRAENGNFEEAIPCEIVGGDIPAGQSREAMFSSKQIMDALKHAESEKVTWGLTGQYSPSVIRAAGDDRDKGNKGDDGWLCIVVPGRVAGE